MDDTTTAGTNASGVIPQPTAGTANLQPAGTTPAPPPAFTPQDGGQGGTPGDPATLQAELTVIRQVLAAANAESAQRRHKLAEYERIAAQNQAATLTTEQRLAAAETARQASEDALKKARLEIAFGRAVRTAKLNFANERAATDAYLLADLTGAQIADDGTVTGLDPAIAALKAERGYLFAAPTPPPATDATKTGEAGQKLSDVERTEMAAIYNVNPKYL